MAQKKVDPIIVPKRNPTPRLSSIRPKQSGVFLESAFANEFSPLKLPRSDFKLVLRRPIETTALIGDFMPKQKNKRTFL